MWPLLAFSSLSMTHGAWAGALLMFRHLSAPSRAARLNVSTAEPWKASSPNWDPNTPTRSPRLTTWPLSWRSRASWRRPGWGRWGAERWPSWHCREEGISHVARTRRVNCFSQFHQSTLGMWIDAFADVRTDFDFSLMGKHFSPECWTALLLVYLLWNYWVNHQRHGPSKPEGLDYLTILSGGKYRSFSWHLVLNPKSAWRALGIVCSHYSPKIVAFVGFSSLSMTHGAWAGALLMFHHLSAPPRAARRKGCTAEPWEGRESQLGPQHPETLNLVNNLAMLLQQQGKLEEAGLRSSGYTEVTEVLRGRHFSSGQDKGLVSFLFPSFTGAI